MGKIRTTTKLLALGVVAVLAVLFAATVPAGAAKQQGSEPVTLRLGYFPNVTHAPAIVGVQNGIFQKALGKNVDLKLSTFNSGTDELTAIGGGALDAAYIGPNPTITAWTQLDKGVKIVSGAASGGAYFVVKPSITSAADLKGKTVASPQLGNTQDVALRNWLKSKGLQTDTSGGGDVKIVPQDNATALASFEAGSIDGAWVPEPWATRLVNEGGGKVLVNEADLWPGGKYVTTQLIVTTDFLKAHPDVVQKLVNGQVAANDYIKTNTADAETAVSNGIKAITGKALSGDLIIASFKNIDFTNDPIASSLVKDNTTQKSFGFPAASRLKGLYDLSFLNKALTAAKEPTVSNPKL
jgi:NitT/TauT family transport system substrate-binding protein